MKRDDVSLQPLVQAVLGLELFPQGQIKPFHLPSPALHVTGQGTVKTKSKAQSRLNTCTLYVYVPGFIFFPTRKSKKVKGKGMGASTHLLQSAGACPRDILPAVAGVASALPGMDWTGLTRKGLSFSV